MKIALDTPTGHVGSVVADLLLDYHDVVTVTLLSRRANTLRKFVERGAKTAVGALDDVDFLVRSTRNVDALFWVTPPGYGSDDIRAFQNRMGQAVATAVRTNWIPRVVNLSSVGAQWGSGVGPINGLHDVEGLLDEAAANIVHLRPGFFFENLLWQQDSIRNWGTISLPLSGSRRYPMIATRDIGAAAVERLTSTSWTGHNVMELHGPADLCFDDVAQILSEILGRKISFVRCSRQEAHQTMLASGISENAAQLMLEMYEAVDSGRLTTIQARTAETTTPTTLKQFAREVMLPLIMESVAR